MLLCYHRVTTDTQKAPGTRRKMYLEWYQTHPGKGGCDLGGSSTAMLKFFDILLTVIHLAIVAFNLFGWIPPTTRKAHFISVLLTAASWLVLGLWFGLGYCPFTDWQWRVKEQLGETNLPSNFIEYFAEKITRKNFDAQFVNTTITISFAVVALISVYVNFLHRRKLRR